MDWQKMIKKIGNSSKTHHISLIFKALNYKNPQIFPSLFGFAPKKLTFGA